MEEHELYLKIVLEKIEREKAVCKVLKVRFWLRKVAFLGHMVSEEGILVDSSKVKTIIQWKQPRNSAKVRSFLGLARYYWKFVDGFF